MKYYIEGFVDFLKFVGELFRFLLSDVRSVIRAYMWELICVLAVCLLFTWVVVDAYNKLTTHPHGDQGLSAEQKAEALTLLRALEEQVQNTPTNTP